jgi:polar amino acid transport system permease protein
MSRPESTAESPVDAPVERAHGELIRAVPARYPGRWIVGVIALAFAVFVIQAIVTSPNIDWGQVGHYLTYPTILKGLLLTIELTFIGMAIGVLGGILLAIMRLSANPVLRAISWVYIWFFRGTPLLIQIIFWFNISLIFPRIMLVIPGTEIGYRETTNALVTATVAAILALGLNEAAYMAEIVRGGLNSVDQGQEEAASSIGLSRWQTMRLVILPQAIRTIIPPTGNEFIGMLKNTSLVSVIAARELLTASQQIYAQNFETIELLIVASIWYLVLTTIQTYFQGVIERRMEVSLRTRTESMPRQLWNSWQARRNPISNVSDW